MLKIISTQNKSLMKKKLPELIQQDTLSENIQEFSDWDKVASTWDNADVKEYRNKAFELLIKNTKNLVIDWENLRILDFGCGTGLLTEKLQPLCKEIIAIDPSREMIKVLDSKIKMKNLVNIKTFNQKINDKFIKQHEDLHESQDIIVASSVLSFIPNRNEVVSNLTKLLSTGGLLVSWDWFSEADSITPGSLSIAQIKKLHAEARLTTLSISIGFELQTFKVVMAIAKKESR